MRLIPSVLVVILALHFPTSVKAQRNATDNELYASYCIGVTIEREAMFTPIIPEMLSESDKEGIAKYKALDERFETYLVSTGALDGRGRFTVAGLESALKRGESDSHQCQIIYAKCAPLFGADGKPVSPPPPDEPLPGSQAEACSKRSPYCVRSLRCQGADNLPF